MCTHACILCLFLSLSLSHAHTHAGRTSVRESEVMGEGGGCHDLGVAEEVEMAQRLQALTVPALQVPH
jgi:hypothetical protein